MMPDSAQIPDRVWYSLPFGRSRPTYNYATGQVRLKHAADQFDNGGRFYGEAVFDR